MTTTPRKLLLCLLAGFAPALVAAADQPRRPNVVFIAIDDQNDWIGHMGGHPLAKTPNIDRLAARGTSMLNAHCNSPLCNPSRTSLMLSLRPTTTGIYGLAPWFRAQSISDSVKFLNAWTPGRAPASGLARRSEKSEEKVAEL